VCGVRASGCLPATSALRQPPMPTGKRFQVETTALFIAATTLFAVGTGTDHWIQGWAGGSSIRIGLWEFCTPYIAGSGGVLGSTYIASSSPVSGCFSIDSDCNYDRAVFPAAGLPKASCGTFMAVRVLARAALFFSFIASLLKLATLAVQATALRVITFIFGAIAGAVGMTAMSVFIIYLLQNNSLEETSAPFHIYSYDYSFAMVAAAWALQLAGVRLLLQEDSSAGSGFTVN